MVPLFGTCTYYYIKRLYFTGVIKVQKLSALRNVFEYMIISN